MLFRKLKSKTSCYPVCVSFKLVFQNMFVFVIQYYNVRMMCIHTYNKPTKKHMFNEQLEELMIRIEADVVSPINNNQCQRYAVVSNFMLFYIYSHHSCLLTICKLVLSITVELPKLSCA